MAVETAALPAPATAATIAAADNGLTGADGASQQVSLCALCAPPSAVLCVELCFVYFSFFF